MEKTVQEVELMVEQLECISMEDVGGVKWFQQHQRMEALNIQAHANLKQGRDEYVTESILSFQKMPMLVHDLLVHETWRRKIYPLLLDKLDDDTSMKAYTLLYHESTVMGLLTVSMFSKSATLALGDVLLDLVDYCARAVVFLNTCKAPLHLQDVQRQQQPAASDPNHDPREQQRERIRQALQKQESVQEQLSSMVDPLEFGIAIHALSVLRFITDSIHQVPLSVLHRILNHNETISQLIYLLDKAPWHQRKSNGTQLLRYEDGQWNTVAETEQEPLLVLGKVEAQVWLSLYNLLVEPECRRQFVLTSHRQETVLKLRSHFTAELVDQLPMLVAVQRAVEEVSLMGNDSATQLPSQPNSARIEQVPELLEQICQCQDWNRLAQQQWDRVFAGTDRRTFLLSLSELYNMDTLESLLPDDPRCAHCGLEASQRCSRCKNEWYCGRACQVASWKVHKKLCDLLHASPDSAMDNRACYQGSVECVGE